MLFRMLPILLAIHLVTACATTQTKPVDPQKQAELDRQYQELQAQKAAIQAETAALSGDSNALFQKAGQLEKKLKVGAKASLGAWSTGAKNGKLAGVLGPVSFDKKSASFRLVPGQTSGAGILILPIDFQLVK